jgi:glycosyltransferase involved in cell wall biosynthesis
MLLSIIIPVYNLENYIGRCLDSCLAQTVQGGYEIICVNDGSKDNSLSVLREYESKYPNIRVIDKPNGGVSSARNAGIAAATGEYIWFVDGDDWVATESIGLLEKELHRLSKKPDCFLFEMNKAYKYTSTTLASNDSIQFCEETDQGSFYNSLFVFCRWFKTVIVKENALFFDETLKYSEDFLYTIKFNSFCKKIISTQTPIYFYFQRQNSATHTPDVIKQCEALLTMAVTYKKLQKKLPGPAMRIKYIRSMQVFCQYLCCYCSQKSVVRAILKQLKYAGLYPYGVDFKQFRRDKRQSVKSDLLNWLFGFLSWKPYFWFCWLLCSFLFKSKRTITFDVAHFENTLHLIEQKD